MAVQITTPIPSVEETAKRVGVSKKRASELARYAEQTIRIPARRVVTAAKKKPVKRGTVAKNK